MNYLNRIPSNYMFPAMNNKLNVTMDPYMGFVRGNLFENLYEPYKNYKVKDLNPTNEKDAMLLQLMQYNFALVELNLYLDVNPDDNNALKLYNDYLKIKKQLENKYESNYGPIDNCSNFIATGSWNWDNGPWPWEVSN